VYLSVLDSDVHAESDAEGGVAIELDGGKGAIAAYLDGYAISRFEFDGGDLVLRPAESVRGTVLNEKREPVPFAPVRLESGFGAPQFARTDAAGAFEFAIGVSGFAFVHVERRGYLPARVTVDPGWRPDRVRVVLSRGRAVRGSVLRGGKPVMGACVTAWRVLGTGEREEVARAYTDGGGNAALLAVPADAGVLTAHADGDRSGELPIAESMSFVLTADPPIRGRVVDDTGKPLQKLIVSLSRNKLGRHVSTDAQGKFEFTGLEPGRYRIGFGNAVGYVNVRRSVVRGQLVELVAERVLGTRTLTVEVMPARAHLSRVVLEGDGWRRVRWLRPGEDGGQFRNLAPGEYRVRVESPGFQDVSAVAEVYGDHRASIARIRLARAGTLRLKATPGAAVVVQTLEGEPAPSVTLKLEDGSLELAGFGPGRYRFLSRAPGEIIVVEEIEVGEKDPPRDLDLSGGPASTLKITVTDSARNPVRGVSIDLLTEGGLRFPTRVMTDANGVAALARLIRGRLVIVAQKGDLRVEKAIAIGSGAAHEAALVLE
ncbi:MAG: carboxypeptidase regulatory-like domain-containing protein, partial [Planctomycetota bacterium]